MKVLYIPSSDDKYGAPRAMMDLIECLKRKYDVEPVVMTCTACKINDWCDKRGIENYVLGQGAFIVAGGSNIFRKIVKRIAYPYLVLKYKKQNRTALSKIEELIDFSQIDIVHTNVPRIDIGALYAKKHSIPHVWHLREFGKEDYNVLPLVNDFVGYMNSTTDAYVAISDAVKKAWLKKGADSRKIHTIYDGISIQKYPLQKDIVSNNGGPLRIAFAGLVSETKGQIFQLKALASMPQELRTNFVVDFYGGGREVYIEKLKKYAKANDIERNVKFHGYCENLPELLFNHDIGVIASRSEAFGLVTAEYMACGLAVLASNTGANPELIENNVTGLLYRYADYQNLSEALIYLNNHRSELYEMRRAGRLRVQEKFTMELCADKVYALYNDLLTDKLK